MNENKSIFKRIFRYFIKLDNHITHNLDQHAHDLVKSDSVIFPEYKFTVTIPWKKDIPEYDWCVDRMGLDHTRWRFIPDGDGDIYSFMNEDDYTAFKLAFNISNGSGI